MAKKNASYLDMLRRNGDTLCDMKTLIKLLKYQYLFVTPKTQPTVYLNSEHLTSF